MRNRNGWIALSLILTPPLSLCETLLRKSVVTELGYLFPESHPPFLSHWWHLGVLIVDGYSSLLYYPPVWFVIHLSTFLWRFEALILPAVTKIFLSFEKWVIMNWWVMFASCLRIFFLEWILGQIFNSSFSLNWGLKAVIKFHNVFNDFVLIMIN